MKDGRLLVRVDGPSPKHGTETESQTTNSHNPRACHHQPIDETTLDHLSRSDTDDANTESGVEKGRVEIGALEHRHTTVFSGLTVEDSIDGDKRTSKDCATR